ncbi:MAG: hypothetical protein ACE1ZT_04760, partial [Dehalococcoidia bacterium]
MAERSAKGGRAPSRRRTRADASSRKRAVLSLHNTLTGNKEPFAPLEPGLAKIYTCGPTVYRHAHIGNLRTYLIADWLRRLLESSGY